VNSRLRILVPDGAAGAAPATATALGVHGTLSRYDLRAREYTVPIANLPPELEGFTIAHVSDLHSGVFCGPQRLANIVEATNDLNADLIVLTGDVKGDYGVTLKDGTTLTMSSTYRRRLAAFRDGMI